MPVSWNKKFFVLLLLTVFYLVVNGQKTDSLINVLKTTTQDTLKVNVMVLIFTEYSKSGDLTEAKKWVEDAMALAQKTKNPHTINIATIALGNYYHRKGNILHGQDNYPEALSNYLVALKIFEKIG